MANGDEKSGSKDFYQVLGLNKECSATELRNAYKKLALRWHPDRCSGSGNSKFVEEAKKKFQAVQQAYSVLSDANKRFLYDVGVYDSDDDEDGMGDFLNEMAVMMSQTKPSEDVEESFEELQDLFEELFQEDMESYGASYQTASSSSSYASYSETSNSNNKRVSCEMNGGKNKVEGSNSDLQFDKFSLGAVDQDVKKGKGVRGGARGGAGDRRRGRKQKISSGHDVSCNDYGISAS
ncbi:hypothetical protein Tsubulata_044338 [Turnera subulata]|uniref:J domain-containing protein n=1 Tax=Turnera subulata TaxID=218843 RepID=A0A9Q0FTD7_9ROSI|nr:hypothetical protein Tsubulata_044338 [Turnera subulata]